MSLKLQEFGGILLRSEQSVSLSIAHVRPYLVAFVCVPPFCLYTAILFVYRHLLIFFLAQF